MTDPTPDGPDLEARRIWMRSRRGLRELDLLLMPYVEDVVPKLDAEGRARYVRLVDREDMELFAWLMRREVPEDAELRATIDDVLAAQRYVS